MDALTQLFETPDPLIQMTHLDHALWVAARIMLSGVLGAMIAFLYRRTRTDSAQNPGLFPTLVLLAMLITLVTIAVGQNVAVAFTLVGTLAIVRFRTTVSDVRDTAFVIFSVAVGIAAGQNPVTAGVGIVVLALAIEVLHRMGTLTDGSNGGGTSQYNGTLRLSIVPPNPDPDLFRPILERFAITAQLTMSKVDRDRSRLQLTFAIRGKDADQLPALSTALLEKPEITEASAELGL